MDDATYAAIRVVSKADGAEINFICRSEKDSGEVMFFHREFLTSSGELFRGKVRFDKKNAEDYKFNATSDGKGGTLNRYFGIWDRPSQIEIVDGKAQLAFGYPDNWFKIAFNEFINKFSSATRVLVRVFDFRGKSFTYEFDPRGMKEMLIRLKPCID